MVVRSRGVVLEAELHVAGVAGDVVGNVLADLGRVVVVIGVEHTIDRVADGPGGTTVQAQLQGVRRGRLAAPAEAVGEDDLHEGRSAQIEHRALQCGVPFNRSTHDHRRIGIEVRVGGVAIEHHEAVRRGGRVDALSGGGERTHGTGRGPAPDRSVRSGHFPGAETVVTVDAVGEVLGEDHIALGTEVHGVGRTAHLGASLFQTDRLDHLLCHARSGDGRSHHN